MQHAWCLAGYIKAQIFHFDADGGFPEACAAAAAQETVENPFAAAIAARGAAAPATQREAPKGEFKQLLAAVASEGAEAPLGSAARAVGP